MNFPSQTPKKKIALSKAGLFSMMGAFSGDLLAKAGIEAWGMTQEGKANPALSSALEAEPCEPDSTTEVHQAAPVASGIKEGMSFEDAFAAARAELGAGGVFDWQGQVFGTWYKEEWEAMDKSEQDAYWASIEHEAATYTSEASSVPGEGLAELPLATDADDQPDEPLGDDDAPATPVEYVPATFVSLDLDQDRVFEATGVDENSDGVFEALFVDANQNQVPEQIMLDTNADGILDAVMADLDEDGTMDTRTPMEQEILLQTEDSAVEQDPELSVDDNPDFDNDADMSDWV